MPAAIVNITISDGGREPPADRQLSAGVHPRRRWTAVGLAWLTTLALVALSACSGGRETSTPSGGSPGTGTSGSSPPTARCAWPTKAGKDVQNVAYPDTSATYWVLSYSLAPGERLVLRGRYPDARYLSFITYAPTGGALGVLTDRDIVPDEGSANPFAGGRPSDAEHRSYTVEVGLGAPASVPTSNFVAAAATASSPGSSNTTASDPSGTTPGTQPPLQSADALLGSGGPGATGGALIYRVYVPASDADPTGGAGLPGVSLVAADGTTTAIETCERPGPSANAERIINTYGPATDTAPPASPIFIRPGRNGNNLFPNPDNIYVATIVRHQPGEVILIRGKAPTFPDTRAGQPVTGDEQVRFWSLCTNEYRKPYPVSFCTRDDQTALDAQQQFTFVISTPEDRPSNATADNGYTWLDYGSPTGNSVLLFRHMLASPAFAESATKLAPGALATSSMGPYAPHGVYCARATFEASGAAGCGL